MAQEIEAKVLVTRHSNGFVELRLNRASKFNSLDEDMLSALKRAVDSHAATARGFILTAASEARAFCAGGDIKYACYHRPTPVDKAEFLHLEYSVHEALQVSLKI
jgi:enoyl-CoA hydratase/carnithine racemase